MKLFDLTGRVAIVTGGNGGIGLGLALGLAEAGAKIAITGRNAGKAETALAQLHAFCPDAIFVETDQRKEAACNALIATVAEKFGRLDILVNNAGAHAANLAASMTLDEWNVDIETNLTGMFLCCRAAYPEMVAQGGGKVINVGSIASFMGQPWAANYGATKGGVEGLTKSLAVEWADSNIQVNSILPGFIATDMTAATKQVPGFEEMVANRALARRWGQGDDFRGIGERCVRTAENFESSTRATERAPRLVTRVFASHVKLMKMGLASSVLCKVSSTSCVPAVLSFVSLNGRETFSVCVQLAQGVLFLGTRTTSARRR